jgi:type IV pilus assembly protein PilY1
MNLQPLIFSTKRLGSALLVLLLVALSANSFAASVALASSPLATSTATNIQPNVLFVLDDSGSMAWDYMPDAANFGSGVFGSASYQCNGVSYNPSITYLPPVNAAGVSYANATFTAAWNDGFAGGSTTNLSTRFVDSGGDAAQAAFYYSYSGTQTTEDLRNFSNTNSTFYRECNSRTNQNPGKSVFTKVIVSATSGPGGTDERTNFANWYSYYHTRILMMKTAAGRAFSNLNKNYRVGFMTINSTKPSVPMGTFADWTAADPISSHPNDAATSSTQRSTWYATFYGITPNNSTPLRQALSYAGRYYAGKLSGIADPLQYSCQQNFSILSTDGFWNESTGNWNITGAARIGNQDGTKSRPFYDGGSTSDTLADVAMYYYQTDLRTPALSNCGTPATTGPLCDNNVFISSADNNLQQHMTTFTLGLGASGQMTYSSSYLSDIIGDYVSVKLGSTASASTCTWQTAGTTCNWPIPASNALENIDDLWHAAVNGHGAYFSATDPATLSVGLANALAGINARKGAAAAAATSTLNPVAGNNFTYVASYTTIKWQGNLEARGININTGVVSENAIWCVENVAPGTCSPPSSIVTDATGGTTATYCSTPNSVICTGGTLSGTNCLMPIATACTGTMNSKVASGSDTRTIWTANSAGTALTAFDSAYATANPSNFSAARLSGLSQWTSLTASQQSAATGSNLVNYLRGQNGYEDRTTNAVSNRLYRYREAVLGDALESQPAYIGAPVFSYPYAGYSAYVTAQAARAGTVYMGANDGMMHAFAADTGIERWAYVPSMVVPSLWHLADFNYPTLHNNFVNGSPTTSDICIANCTVAGSAVWKTILVAGLNGGGRGYYALDITDPANPSLLWELTPSTGNGKIKDDDVGYEFGQPVITRKIDGTWVVLVTSGYNNTGPGTGLGYLYVLDAGTGAIISKISTATGSLTTPSGLAKIAVWNNESGGNLAGYAYGGDLLGNVWRFDINAATAATIGTGAVLKFATLLDAGGLAQPITTSLILGSIAGQKVIFVGTGKYLEISDLSNTQLQTQYAIKDDETGITLINARSALVQQTLINNPNGTATRVPSNNAVNFATGRGWYVDFPDAGERVNIDSKLVSGTLLVPTIVPSNTACSPGGYGWLNYFNYSTGGVVNAPSNTTASIKVDAPIVGVNVLYIQGQPQVRIVTSTNPTPTTPSGAASFFGAPPAGFTGKRVIWRELIP